MKIEMIGYNDSKTIAIYGNIKLLPVLIISFLISILMLIPCFIFKIYEMLFIFILPFLIFSLMIIQYLINSKYKTFLKDQKTKHKFCLENKILYKDGKAIKNIDNIRLYKFKNYLFLELKESFYRINNDDYLLGSREEFLSRISYSKKHYIRFD